MLRYLVSAGKLKTLDFTDFCPIFWYNDLQGF